MKHTLRHLLLAFMTIFSVVFMTSTAFASGNDFKLERLCSGSSCSSDSAINDFKGIARTYSAIFAPMHMNPASTIGEEGFEIGVSTKMSFATQDDTFWKATNKNNPGNTLVAPSADGKFSAPDVFSTIQVAMRKGLPFSLEVEGEASWLADSEMFYIGAGLRWAITEGWWFLPDLSVRGHVGTLVGASQLSFINVNVDAALSYTWGLGGVASITPYGGYSMLISIASSHALVLYPGDGNPVESVFSQQTQYVSRGFVGIQLKGEYFIFDVAGEFGKNVESLGVKIGALF